VSTVIVRTMARVLTPGIFLLSLYLLARGHHQPGGGFIGGLVAGGAAVLLHLAWGAVGVRRLRVDGPVLLATGLLLAVGYGLAGLAFGDAFLQGAIWRLEALPGVGEVKVAASLVFDVGIYLVVIGLVVTYLRALGEEGP
jgi:multisubunit Na+/H+ antiporter MnhB subunit